MSASTTSPRKRGRGAAKAAPATPGRLAFVFTGDPINGQDPERIALLGYEFELNGAPVEVSDAVAAKLEGHTHFRKA